MPTSEIGESEHQQTLNRLYWELKQRKRLFGAENIYFGRLHSNLDDMSKSLAQVKEKIATKQAYLDRIGGYLKDVLEVCTFDLSLTVFRPRELSIPKWV